MAPPDIAMAGVSPAGYGRSCINCSRSKTKCIVRPRSDVCERCCRLKKDCQPMATSRKRTMKKPPSSKTAQLEEKIDDLVSILRASQQASQPSSQTSSTPESTPSQRAFPSRLDSLAAAATSTTPQTRPQPTPASHFPVPIISISKDACDLLMKPSEADFPTPEEAEAYLDKFRGWLRNFPFMHIPHNQSAESLRLEKPFLFKCIMGISTMSIRQLHKIRDDLRKEAAQRVVVEHERSLDLLLGLICYVAWASINTGPGPKPFLVIYSQLAATLLYDLGLTKSPTEEHYFTTCFKVLGMRPGQIKLRTMEERRATVATWYITSTNSAFVGKMDTIRWTPHMDDCLAVLEREREYPEDDILVAIIRMQLVSDEAQKLLNRDLMSDNKDQAPTFYFKKHMLERLQSIRAGFSPGVSSNCTVQAHLFNTETLIHSVGMFRQNIPEASRVDSMYACLVSVKMFFNNLFAQPLRELPALPFSIFIQMLQTLVSLYRLTITEDPAWDKEQLRNTANLLTLFDQLIDHFPKVLAEYPMQGNADETIFCVSSKMIKNIKLSWEPVLSQHLNGLPTPNSQMAAGLDSAPEQEAAELMMQGNPAMADPSQFEFGDLVWMQDVFGPWDF